MLTSGTCSRLQSLVLLWTSNTYGNSLICSISRVSSIHSNPQGPDSCCSAANNSVTKPGEAFILTVLTDIIMAIGYPRGKPNFLYLAHALDSLHILQHQSGPYPFLHFSPCAWYLYVDWSSLLFIDRNGMIPLLA